MFGRIRRMVNPHYYFIIAIPCMSMFSFRFKKKYKIPAILLAVFAASILRIFTRAILIGGYQNSEWRPGFLFDQSGLYLKFSFFAVNDLFLFE